MWSPTSDSGSSAMISGKDGTGSVRNGQWKGWHRIIWKSQWGGWPCSIRGMWTVATFTGTIGVIGTAASESGRQTVSGLSEKGKLLVEVESLTEVVVESVRDIPL
ncbi:hypothetical protein TNCT_684391 [Trichonephila clavata]|uniref:Uncharacterized protein n=1 Tax=Trichonephila clavata TaxID=2740835 RepID=A0A8X6J5H4_TRICU|nr:hypothetical protein TNCT_684391 [Trichonephila clavata]